MRTEVGGHPQRAHRRRTAAIALIDDHLNDVLRHGLEGLDGAERFLRALLPHAPQASGLVFDATGMVRFAQGRVEGLSPETWDRVEPLRRRVLSGEQFAESYETGRGSRYRLHAYPIRAVDGSVCGGLLIGHENGVDSHERLAERLTRQVALAELATRALAFPAGFSDLIVDATELVVEALTGACCASVVRLLPDAEMQLVRLEASGALIGRRVPLSGSLAQRVLHAQSPSVVIEDAGDSSRLPSSLVAMGVRSAACVVVGRPEQPLGVLSAFAMKHSAFAAEDVVFLAAMANVLADAARREESEAVLRRQATHDGVTGLPNRALLDDRLRHALSLARRNGSRVGVFFVDLDNFKLVNDTLGHDAGDEVLRAVAAMMGGRVRASDTLARFGGDEFVVVVPALDEDRDAARVAEGLLAALTPPIEVEGRSIQVGASVGVVITVPGPEDEPRGLLRDADAAMYRAKRQGRGRYEIFMRGSERALDGNTRGQAG